MFECFRSGAGEILARADYLADFSRVHQRDINLLAKIERGQTFKEQGSPSWDAFASGDWAGARRFTDPGQISRTTREFEALYAMGEGFPEFFEREIAPPTTHHPLTADR